MEFVAPDEVKDLLQDHRFSEVPEGDRVYLRMDGDSVIHLHLTSSDDGAAPHEDANVVKVAKERLAESVDHIVQGLRLTEVILLPVARWRNIFDAVAFSLADNEDWQEFDAAATVELNTRDPLMCTPSDFHTLNAMIRALMGDEGDVDQGLFIVTPATPVMLEMVPDSDIRISVGSQAVADEVGESLGIGVGG